MKVYEHLAMCFAAEGVDAVFALMGDGNMAFLGSLASTPGVNLVQVRHENMAVGMADGYFRARGTVGVASVTYGPGLTQIPTSLMVAGRHHSPVVVFAGEPPQSDRYPGSAHDIDQRALIEGAEAAYISVRSPASVADDVARAFELARFERRPVVIGAAVDVQYLDAVNLDRHVRAPRVRPAAEPLSPSLDAVAAAAALIAQAQRPLILAGTGALGATTEIEVLADRVGASIVTTIAAKGAFAGNPRSAGLTGSFADEHTKAAFEQADLVIAVGTSLDPYVTHRGDMLADVTVVQLDVDPNASIALVRRADVLVIGDSRLSVAALNAQLARGHRARVADPAPPYDFAAGDMAAFPCDPEEGTLDPRVLMAALGELLPDDCQVVVGAGHFSAFPLLYLPGRRSHRYLPVFDFGSIGQGMPVAVGAAIARPERPVIAFEGDASLLMNVQELETIGRVRPRLLLFVLNDGALGAEYHRLGRMGIDPGLAAYDPAGFEAVANAFGVPARTLREVGEAQEAVEAFLSGDGPMLVDVRSSRRSIVPLYRPQPPVAS